MGTSNFEDHMYAQTGMKVNIEARVQYTTYFIVLEPGQFSWGAGTKHPIMFYIEKTMGYNSVSLVDNDI